MDIAYVSHLRSNASSHLRGIGPADILWAAAAPHLCIFASSAVKMFSNPLRSIASLHLRIFSCQDVLKPSPHLRIFASSHLRLSRFSQTLSASSHLCIFASSALSRNVKIRYFLSQKVKIRAMSRKNARNCVPSRLRILISPALTNYLTN